MSSCFRCQARKVLVFVLFLELPTVVLSQGAPKWRVEAPPNSVELIESVQREMYGVPGMCFTIKNTSQKTIASLVLVAPAGWWWGGGFFPMDIGPGSTQQVYFYVSDFFDYDGKLISRSFRVGAIIYSDGSTQGTQPELTIVEDQMLGVALEFKRVDDLLAARVDDSENSLRDVVAKIGSLPPVPRQSLEESTPLNSSVRAVTLPGVRQSFIEAHLNRFSGEGIRHARASILALLGSRETVSEKAKACHMASETQTRLIRGISESLKGD